MADRLQFGNRLLVIFDGQCGFCNSTVRWFVRRDRRDRLRFAASDSPMVAGVIARHGNSLPGQKTASSTILVVREFGGPGESILVRSDAAMAMLLELPQPWPAVATLMRLIPRPIRNLGYRLVAHWRSRIWGRVESCPPLTAEERERFL